MRTWHLKPYFEKAGEFDEELFNKRVFIVDAKRALKLKCSGASSTNEEMKSTVLPALEAELARLVGEEKEQVQLNSSVRRRVLPALRAAKHKIASQKGAFDAAAEHLETAHRNAEARKNSLNAKARRIGDNFGQFMEYLGRQTAASIRRNLENKWSTFPDNWKQFSQKFGKWQTLCEAISQRKEFDTELNAVFQEYLKFILDKHTSEKQLIQDLEPKINEFAAAAKF